MIRRLRYLFPSFFTSILDSYTQIFFSNSRIFAVILLIVSFFDFFAGLAGIFSVIVSNIAAYLIGLKRSNIRAGYYGFNSLLVGLGMGIFYQPGPVFFVFLFFGALLTLFLTVMMEGIIGKYGLPFMSLPFLLGIWLMTLSARQFSHLAISERYIYLINDLYSIGGIRLVNLYNKLNELPLHPAILIYFRSLGAIFFQHHLIAGVLISIGLLICSRISFMLSWTGFLAAYVYHIFMGASPQELSYGYIGFNYILTSIAIGGFFLIPSWHSFLWVILLIPLISILQISTMQVFSILQLSVYSLPFNIIVLLFLYLLKFRERFHLKPLLVAFQQYSPEKNLYSGLNYFERFGTAGFLPFSLPFFGKWKVTQGENGDITHRGEWKNAWDFEIADEKGKTFLKEGTSCEDYYCYGKPVLAPADGIVEEIRNDVEDNEIGKINTDDNWGNAVVIKHADMLYSQVCHLKKGSVKPASGDLVKKGDLLGYCGNSGRSPVPHLHVQFQSTPFIGSRTISYPFSHFIRHSGEEASLRSYQKPDVKSIVSNIEKSGALEKAFHLIPGQKLTFAVSSDSEEETICWEVKADYLNNTFIYCENSGSKAYFRQEGPVLYFTGFEGKRSSLLYQFYLGAWKVITGFYPGLVIRDSYPLNILRKKFLLFLQDLIAPFYRFLRADYRMEYAMLEDHFTHSKGKLRSFAEGNLFGKMIFRISYEFILSEKGIEEIIIKQKNITKHVRRIW